MSNKCTLQLLNAGVMCSTSDESASQACLQTSLQCESACLDVVPSTYVVCAEQAQQILKGALQSAQYQPLD